MKQDGAERGQRCSRLCRFSLLFLQKGKNVLFFSDFPQVVFRWHSDSITQFNPVRGFLIRVIPNSNPNVFREKFV